MASDVCSVTPDAVLAVSRTGEPADFGTYILTVDDLLTRAPYTLGRDIWTEDYVEVTPEGAQLVADAISEAAALDDGLASPWTDALDVLLCPAEPPLDVPLAPPPDDLPGALLARGYEAAKIPEEGRWTLAIRPVDGDGVDYLHFDTEQGADEYLASFVASVAPATYFEGQVLPG